MSKKVSQEDDASSLTGAELVRIVQGGVSKKTTTADIAALATGGGGSPTVVQNSVPTAVAKPMPQEVSRIVGNPVLTYGTTGEFDAGSLRDGDLFYARNKLWLMYTGALTSGTPYHPTIGLAWSDDDGDTWTKVGQVIAANAIPSQWNSGGVFSPCVVYDDATDELYVYVTGVDIPANWYGGNMDIGVLKVDAGLAWDDPANYVYLNSGAPVLSPSAGWEDIRVYSPSVKYLNGQYVMLYNSYLNSGPTWQVGRATAPAPAGPWTKDAGNPLFAAAEEMSMVTLPGGTLIALCDDLSSAGGPYGIGVYSCSTQDGTGDWTKIGRLLTDGAQTFDAAAVGSSAAVVAPDGAFIIAYNGLPAGAGSNDARKMGVARGRIALNVAPDEDAINALIAAAATGPGSNDAHYDYVQFHVLSKPGVRIFDTGPRRRIMGFTGSITNSTANPCFGTTAVHSVSGSGYMSLPNSPEFDINGTEDFTLEIWASFTNAASALEMIFEQDINGLALYRRADGKIELAKSRVTAIHTGATVVGAGGYHLIVIQRTAGTLAGFIAAQGASFMSADGSGVSDTTTFSSTSSAVMMAATSGTANFMSGDIAEVRFTPGVSRGYTTSTPVPTAPFPS